MKTERSVLGLVETAQHGLVVTIECSLSNNLPNIVIVGYANKAASESAAPLPAAISACRANESLLNAAST